MREIALINGGTAKVDDNDFEWLNQYRWYKNRSGYAIKNSKMVLGRKEDETYMHKMFFENSGSCDVDHIDRDRLNNQRSNLRVATRSQNNANTSIRKDSSSGFKGVSFHKPSQLWLARISVNGKRLNIGYFCDPKTAHEEYCKMGIELYGEFFNKENVCIQLTK